MGPGRAQKYEEGKEVVKAMKALQDVGALPKWGMKEGELQRRNVFLRQLNEVRNASCVGGVTGGCRRRCGRSRRPVQSISAAVLPCISKCGSRLFVRLFMRAGARVHMPTVDLCKLPMFGATSVGVCTLTHF